MRIFSECDLIYDMTTGIKNKKEELKRIMELTAKRELNDDIQMEKRKKN